MQWFVAEDDGELVGTAAAILPHDGSYIFKERSATLAGIYVMPAYRKRGIARELTQRAIDWCKEHRCVSIRLRASAAGRPLYESLGFETGDEMVLDLR
jgi:GNAT superfamily N-acetyltransferase